MNTDIHNRELAGDPDIREQIVSSYLRCKLMKGKKPESVYSFVTEHGIAESDFYRYFASFDALEKEIWNSFFNQAINTLSRVEDYSGYPVKEKLLEFFYMVMEILREHRSYVLMEWSGLGRFDLTPGWLASARKTFIEYVGNLMEEGVKTGEIKHRAFLTDRYPEALWLVWLFILHFWVKDESVDFQNTDALIEKSLKLIFELMGEGPLDTAIDLIKFLYKNR